MSSRLFGFVVFGWVFGVVVLTYTGEYPRLANAPITEALIDIRSVLAPDVSLSDLERIQEFVPALSDRKSRVQGEMRIEVKDGIPQIVQPSPVAPDGYIFTSSTEGLIVQARLDGFTVNKLKPYDRWLTFVGRTRDFWEHYDKIARPQRVTRLSLRYINRLELPVGVDMKDYLTTVPEVGPGIPQNIAQYLMRLVIPDDTSSANAIVTETTIPPESPNAYPIILDIDVSQQVSMTSADPEIWNVLESLRAFKNRIFFKTLTARTLDAYR